MITVRTSKIKGLIVRAGLTQVAFASKIGVTQGYASLFLSGRRGISPPIAKEITAVLKCEFDDVFEVKEG